MMKTLVLFLLALTTAVAAVDLADIISQMPKCALECVNNGTKQVGCGVLDVQCQCDKYEELTKIVAPCLVTAGCKLEQITQTAAVVVKLCESEYNKTHNASDDNGQKAASDSKKSNGHHTYATSSVALVTVLSVLFMTL